MCRSSIDYPSQCYSLRKRGGSSSSGNLQVLPSGRQHLLQPGRGEKVDRVKMGRGSTLTTPIVVPKEPMNGTRLPSVD